LTGNKFFFPEIQPNMFALKHYPEQISGRELDIYLARGWYRMGQTIFTTHFLCFEKTFYSAIWIRQDLQGYTFRKSLRKILRKNDRQFEVSYRPALINEERERLYQVYRQDFPGVLAPTLLDSLQDGGFSNIFDTYEVSIYDEGKLIGLSYFDIGENAVASITGIYHPDYQKHSIGFYTMLKEIQFCQDRGIRYYYPGYVVPGYSRFDYKARIGAVDYYDLRRNDWFAYEKLKKQHIPIHQMELQLNELARLLREAGFAARIKYYPLFEANLFGYWHLPYFDYPILLLFRSHPSNKVYDILIFDPRTQLFQLLRCNGIEDFQFYFNEQFLNSFRGPRFFMELINVEQVLLSSRSAEVMSQSLKKLAAR